MEDEGGLRKKWLEKGKNPGKNLEGRLPFILSRRTKTWIQKEHKQGGVVFRGNVGGWGGSEGRKLKVHR